MGVEMMGFKPTSFLALLDCAVSVWFGVVCGRFYGQKRSPSPLNRSIFRQQGLGAFFMPLATHIVLLRARIKSVISVLSTAQNWGDANRNKLSG